MEEIHRIEHEADEKKHQLTDRLAKAFITPIEREDIISLSYNIDELTDKAEEVFIRIYMNNVQTIRRTPSGCWTSSSPARRRCAPL